MRLLVQRVNRASVRVSEEIVGEIGMGLLLFLGIEDSDSKEDIDYLVNKVVNLRIFDDANGVMNQSSLEIGGEMLVVSQFTLMASTKKGNRPSYIRASKGEVALPMYELFCSSLEEKMGKKVKRGRFGADMKVLLENNGPVTIWMDSKNKE